MLIQCLDINIFLCGWLFLIFFRSMSGAGRASKEYNHDEKQTGGPVQGIGEMASAPQSGYVWDAASGYYYDAASGYYYDGNSGLHLLTCLSIC